MGDGSVYVGARTVETDENTYLPKKPGAINGGIVKRDEVIKSPQVTITVPSIDESITKVKEAGGEVITPKHKKIWDITPISKILRVTLLGCGRISNNN